MNRKSSNNSCLGWMVPLFFIIFIPVEIVSLFLSYSGSISGNISNNSAISSKMVSRKNQESEVTSLTEADKTVEVTMLDVGQGLCVLVHAGDEYMIYDGGGRQASSYVVSYLKNNDIDHLKYMIASHFDEDHIAGLIGVMSTATIDNILVPDYESDTEIYQSFMDHLNDSNFHTIIPEKGQTYDIANGEFQILGPDDYNSESENDNSIVIRLTDGEFSCIMSGDAESEEEQNILNSNFDLASDIYVVGHHGSSSSSSVEFLNGIQAKYALISVGADNDYGHPADDTLKRLNDAGLTIYRTDELGTFTISYNDTEGYICNADGSRAILSSESDSGTDSTSRAISSSEEDLSSETGTSQENDSQTFTYILNTNTLKFHYPSCKSVDKMKEKNKSYITSTHDDMVQQGYSPCGNCHP